MWRDRRLPWNTAVNIFGVSFEIWSQYHLHTDGRTATIWKDISGVCNWYGVLFAILLVWLPSYLRYVCKNCFDPSWSIFKECNTEHVRVPSSCLYLPLILQISIVPNCVWIDQVFRKLRAVRQRPICGQNGYSFEQKQQAGFTFMAKWKRNGS